MNTQETMKQPMKKKCIKILKVVFVLLLTVSAALSNTDIIHADAVTVTAQAAILMEPTTGKILFGKDENKKMYPASMTKILTALVALDYLKPEDLIVTGDELKEVLAGSSVAGHQRGETLTFENLLRGLLIKSGNDSACVIAFATAKKVKNDDNISYSEAEKVFADLMNEKAKGYGATGTHFVNPHGFHDPDHYTTAYDMALISKAGTENEIIKRIVMEKIYQGNGAGTAADKSLKTQVYTWEAHNEIILDGAYHYQYATGMKTGFTDEAGNCLAASAEKNGVQLIAVISNTTDTERYSDAITLFDYGFDNFEFKKVQEKGIVMDTLVLSNPKLGEEETLKVLTKSEYTDFYSKEDISNIKQKITFLDEYIEKDKKDEEDNTQEEQAIKLKAPIEKDKAVGKVVYTINGETIFEDELLPARAVEERTFKSDVKYYQTKIIKTIFTLKAIPYWVVGIVVLFVLIRILVIRSRSRRSRGQYRYRRRY